MAATIRQRDLVNSVRDMLTLRLPLPRVRLGFVGRFGRMVVYVAIVVAVGQFWAPRLPIYDFWLRPLESCIRLVRDVRTGRRRAYEILAPTETEIAEWSARFRA